MCFWAAARHKIGNGNRAETALVHSSAKQDGSCGSGYQEIVLRWAMDAARFEFRMMDR